MHNIIYIQFTSVGLKTSKILFSGQCLWVIAIYKPTVIKVCLLRPKNGGNIEFVSLHVINAGFSIYSLHMQPAACLLHVTTLYRVKYDEWSRYVIMFDNALYSAVNGMKIAHITRKFRYLSNYLSNQFTDALIMTKFPYRFSYKIVSFCTMFIKPKCCKYT